MRSASPNSIGIIRSASKIQLATCKSMSQNRKIAAKITGGEPLSGGIRDRSVRYISHLSSALIMSASLSTGDFK